METLKYCRQADAIFELPSLKELCAFSVVVTTCGVAGALRHLCTSGVDSLLFDVVIVDEAAQATEGESYVPLSLCSPQGVMVLAGDTQQLGPAYRSPAYKDEEIASSLESRLLSYPCYRFLTQDTSKGNEDDLSILVAELRLGKEEIVKAERMLGVFLYQNYRSSRAIFEVSSRLFYRNSLTQCGEESVVGSLAGFSMLLQVCI